MCYASLTESIELVKFLVPRSNVTFSQEAPPIPESVVFVFMAIELLLALSVGIGCVVMSLKLMHTLSSDDGNPERDAYVKMIQSEQQLLHSTVLYGEEHFGVFTYSWERFDRDTITPDNNFSYGSDGQSTSPNKEIRGYLSRDIDFLSEEHMESLDDNFYALSRSQSRSSSLNPFALLWPSSDTKT